MASDKQIAANRRNAMRSTGPRTRSGKARSRANSLRHGLLSKVLVDPALVNETDQLARRIAQEHGKPDDCFESRTISRSRAGHFECARRACAAPGHHLVRACSEHQGRRWAPFRGGLSRRGSRIRRRERFGSRLPEVAPDALEDRQIRANCCLTKATRGPKTFSASSGIESHA